ncbi:MAG: hypothetical protein AAF517_24060 [Planctomycetota bacterium]
MRGPEIVNHGGSLFDPKKSSAGKKMDRMNVVAPTGIPVRRHRLGRPRLETA